MADYERTVLDFYQLPTPYPTEWPSEKDDNDELAQQGGDGTVKRRRASRYQALESAVNDGRSLAAGAQGGGNLVQKDEPDPLGTTDSVVRALSDLGVPLQDDVRLRSRFLLSSTAFSPPLFLSQMHSNADTQRLLQGLDVLSHSIDQKSASLKVLVESNFERFVRAKATIDNVYKEMKYLGAEPASAPSGVGHSRHASRTSLRAPPGGNMQAMPAPHSRLKNALVKDSEYGVVGIKKPLLDVSAKAEEVWGPALGGRDKEEHLKMVASNLERFKDYVELSASVADSIKRKDYETLIESYNRTRSFADDTRRLSQELQGQTPSDSQLYQMVLAGRVWHDVDEQIQGLKRELWKKLSSSQVLPRPDASAAKSLDQHMEIIGLLLDLGVEENPIWVWLLSRRNQLRSKLQATADRAKAEIEILRRRLANSDKPVPQAVAGHFRSLIKQPIDGRQPAPDSADVIELWEKMVSFVTKLISSQGILGELVDFWQTAQNFIDGKTQRTLPLGYNGESQVHHELSQQAVTDLERGAVDLVVLLMEYIQAFFANPPPEDMSLLLSPSLMSPNSPSPGGALSPSRFGDPRFSFDPDNPPPPSPVRGEAWEKLAFWPPWSNAMSAVSYLSKMAALVGSGACYMASIGPVRSRAPEVLEHLKSLVGVSRERSVAALCAAWNHDSEIIKYVEDWQRPAGTENVTRMPSVFSGFEAALLLGMQKILFMPEAMEKEGAGSVVLPPPAKLLQMVRSQYVTTLYKALSGMVENAERSVKKDDDEWVTSQDGWQSSPATNLATGKSTLDAGDRNVRMLLTLANLQALRQKIVPHLNAQFENSFSVKLTDESKTIRDVLSQIDARLFHSYTKQPVDKLRAIVHTGLCTTDWAAAATKRPQSARPYVYEALLSLVLVHSQVSTTAPSLTPQVLSFLLEQTSLQILDALRRRSRYSLEALMQATIDVEFIAQTLSHYMTDRASELQSQIYQELDGRTDNEARAKLQSELPEMRNVLKKLRDASKSEFSCFKKPKRHGHSHGHGNNQGHGSGSTRAESRAGSV
ncbi:hypothetical protein CDD81_5938 [Ophiocordyceps australis]|uniref:Exocyst complex component SEC5 n=1 Tax=Ophiocordyceps australis TaxID=1399860 RepID=A0A2C5YGH8_9HYPO|nr:hypothetical protein CDD81_5938 [Ophiocordyceps australis]